MNTKELKICVICGEKANGFNFNALTCFSCKQFFRRNAPKNKKFTCNFTENCKINLLTRKFCRSCRLKKCYAMGMEKELILTEEEKDLYRKKLLRIRKGVKINYKNLANDAIDSTTDPIGLESDNENEIIPELDENKNISEKHMENKKLIINKIRCDINQLEPKFQFAIQPIVMHLNNSRNSFNELESIKLTELFSAFIALLNPKTIITSEITNYSLLQQVMCLHMDSEVRKVIELTKKLSAFNAMCENDKISMVKYGCLEIIHLRSVLQYNYESKCFTLNIDNNISYVLKLDLLNELNLEIYKPFKLLLSKFNSFDLDSIVLDLLTVITLFNPNRPNIEHKEVIKFQQQIYIHLLRRYLLLKCRSEYEWKSKFSILMNTLEDIHIFDEISRKKIHSYPKLYGPLINEIYDIKPVKT